MTDDDKVFAGSIPEIYDRYLVPLIFESFAEDLADRVAALVPKTLLEIAAGSGVVTRALAARLPESTSLTITDLNQPMLDQARLRQGLDDRITWQQADALNLPFEAGSFDTVCCQFGVMFFPDRIAGYREVRRVLKPGGSFLFNVWDRIEENAFARLVTEVAASIFPDGPPQFLARTPYGYHDAELVHQELQKAGFSQIFMETLERISAAPSPRHPAVAYCQGTPLRNEIEARDASLLDYVTEKASEAIAEHYGEGRIEAKIQGHVILATP